MQARNERERADELGADFAAFVHAKSAVIERVLDEDYDVLTDYTRVPADADVSGTEALRHVHTFFDAALETRAVMDVDWSTQHPELLVAAYNRSRAPASDADGLVAVWNVHLRERPEFTFQAPVRGPPTDADRRDRRAGVALPPHAAGRRDV